MSGYNTEDTLGSFPEQEGLYTPTHLRVSTQLRGEIKMPRVTLSIPKSLWERLKRHPETNWSVILREGIKDKIKHLQRIEELEQQGKL